MLIFRSEKSIRRKVWLWHCRTDCRIFTPRPLRFYHSPSPLFLPVHGSFCLFWRMVMSFFHSWSVVSSFRRQFFSLSFCFGISWNWISILYCIKYIKPMGFKGVDGCLCGYRFLADRGWIEDIKYMLLGSAGARSVKG